MDRRIEVSILQVIAGELLWVTPICQFRASRLPSPARRRVVLTTHCPFLRLESSIQFGMVPAASGQGVGGASDAC